MALKDKMITITAEYPNTPILTFNDLPDNWQYRMCFGYMNWEAQTSHYVQLIDGEYIALTHFHEPQSDIDLLGYAVWIAGRLMLRYAPNGKTVDLAYIALVDKA